MGRPRLCVRHLGSAQQQGNADDKSTTVTARHQAGANEEPYSYHPGGVNASLGDGFVHFLKDTVNLVALRSLLSLNGAETLSADQY